MSEKTDGANWQRLNEVFAAAVELDAEAQSEFLRLVGEEDKNLRLEVEKLLAANSNSKAAGFLARDAFDAGAAQVLGLDETEDMSANKQIGNYRLVSEIGRGGMGAVYLAEREDFRQRVAIKIIKRGMDTDEIIKRFRRERQVLADLNHPHIARLLDGGTTQTGTPFFVMEFVEGVPVTEFCDNEKLVIEERLALFRKICSAVSHIHQQGIVHRDIKPSNILVGKDREPKLLDFGIAKLLATEAEGFTLTQTAADTRMFTPEYASPEQLRGEKVTTASDIYSLGVLLYELLSGHRPFRLKNVSPVEILKIISEQEPTAPSTAALTTEEIARGETTKALSPEIVAESRRESPEKLQRRLRGDLDNITLKALRKEPKQRYATVEQLSEDIERQLEGLPVAARRAPVLYRATRFIRRNQAAALFATLLAVLIIAIVARLAYFRWHSWSEKNQQPPASANLQRKIAVLPFKFTGDETNESLGADLTDSLIARLGRIQELEVRPSSAVAAYANKDAVAAGKELQVETVLESRIEKTGERLKITSRLLKTDGGQILWSGSFDESFADIANAQDAIAERVAGTLLGQLTVEQRKKVKKRYTDNPEAYKLYLQGKHLVNLQNKKSLNQSIQYFNRAIELDPGYALAYAGIADAYQGLSAVYLSAHEAFPKSKAAAIKALELDPELAEARVALAGTLFVYDWNWAAAAMEYERAIELNPNYSSARHWYARHLALTGRRTESIAQFKRARELDPLSPYIALDSNFPDFFDGNYDRAIEQINKAIEIDNNFWFAYWVRGWAYEEKGDIAAAIADYKKAQAIENSAVIQSFLAHAYAVSGKREEARKILNALLELRTRSYVGAPSIAHVYAGLGDREQAFAWLEKGYEERDEWMIWLKYDHRFGSFRSDPRFQDLLRRVGLPD